MPATPVIPVAKTTALVSFIGGTILLLLFCLTLDFTIAVMGLLSTLVIILINLAVALVILMRAYRDKIQRQTTLKAIAILLINVPVLITYCWLVGCLLGYVRITFVNPHKTAIQNLRISGCEEIRIAQLAPGESKTVWVNIPHDCSISIDYMLGKKPEHEEVAGYVTNEGGYITTFKIGTGQKPYDQDL